MKFWCAKHTPTNVWIPVLEYGVDWSLFYQFLEGNRTHAPILSGMGKRRYIPNVSNATGAPQEDLKVKWGSLITAFKYKSQEAAEAAIKLTASKLKVTRDINDVIKDFEVKYFEEYPEDELPWTPSKEQNPYLKSISSGSFITSCVKGTKTGLSRIYCSRCGVYIPCEVTYLFISHMSICPCCVESALGEITEAYKNFPNTKLKERMEIERFNLLLAKESKTNKS